MAGIFILNRNFSRTYEGSFCKTCTSLSETPSAPRLHALMQDPCAVDVLFSGIRRLLPPDFHEALGNLISTIVAHHVPEWREALLAAQVSEPRLLDMDWRVDVKAASNHRTFLSFLVSEP